VGKGAHAPCPPSIVETLSQWWARFRFAHPTKSNQLIPRDNLTLALMDIDAVASAPERTISEARYESFSSIGVASSTSAAVASNEHAAAGMAA
jgi:hypothetical protein